VESTVTTGKFLGTASYAAPEQAGAQRGIVGPATDIYGLGAVLYEMLTGRPPFRAATSWQTLQQVVSTDPVSPRSLAVVSRDLETICLKCLTKDPARRYASAQALADDLHRFLANEPILARPIGWMERTGKWARRRPALAGLVALLFLLALALLGGAPACSTTPAWLRSAIMPGPSPPSTARNSLAPMPTNKRRSPRSGKPRRSDSRRTSMS
jgi:serine/threonine protein kinase